MRARAVLLGALLVAAGTAAAQPVQVDRSEIRFTAMQMGVGVEGRFRKWTADIAFLPQDPARSHAVLDVDLASIDLASEDSEKEVRGALWFDVASHPVARFVSTSVRSLGGDRYEIAGRLSLKGIGREIVVPISVRRDAAASVAEGSFALKRLDYRIGEGMWADTGTVRNEVVVRFRIVLAPGG